MTPKPVRRNALVALALAAALPLASGCLQSAAGAWDDARAAVGAPPAEVTAKSAADEADREARAWDAEARLVNVYALEVPVRDEEHDHERDNASFPLDGTPGNGKAPAWRFTYLSPDAEYSFTVYANGRVDHRETDESDAGDFEELATAPAWNVDSDGAVDRLREHAEWVDGSKDARMVVTSLGMDEENATWALIAYDAHWMGVVGLVDATSGEVEGVHSWNWSTGDWGWAGNWGGWTAWGSPRGDVTFEDTFEGELTRVDPQDRHAFPVDAGGQTITVALETSPSTPADTQLRILDPAGKELPLECGEGSMAGGAAEERCIARATASGEHVLVIALTSVGVYAEYEAHVVVGSGEWMSWDWTRR